MSGRRWHVRIEYDFTRREFCVVIPDCPPEYFSSWTAVIAHVERNGKVAKVHAFAD